jgi:hypothetical protein
VGPINNEWLSVSEAFADIEIAAIPHATTGLLEIFNDLFLAQSRVKCGLREG